ncbi:MAG: endonuclease MutS2 [Spirochaetota bacterium]
MNRHTLRVLEFEKIRRQVRDRCLTAEAARALTRERVATSASEIAELLDRVGVVKRCLGTTTEFPSLGFPPVSHTLERLSKEGIVLDPLEIAEIALFARSLAGLCGFLTKSAAEAGVASEMERLLGEMPDVEPIYAHLFRYVDPDGTIREREIPELRAIRSEIVRAQQDLQRGAAALANRDDYRRYLSATVPTQRDGRTVLALKSDHRGKLQGIVHEVSASGATVFIEPEELVARNNAVVEAENRYRNELLKILRELTSFCARHRATLLAALDLGVRIDRVYCRARYAYDFACERAGVASDSLMLRDARHPLLGEHAVPINVEVPAGKRVLIVTGPNTGGKTVSLKTVGLVSLMNQFGLEIPAGPGSELPIFSGVYADIGDEQSIEQNLSTFSGHMRNIARILNHADDSSLVLLDELGSGTDPEEGGALAMSILDELLARRPFTVVTTHHGRLKHYGFTHEQATNASVEFDPKSLRPTYHIIPGVPGSSHAVEIAAQMGLLRAVTARARDYLAGEEYDTGRIIRRLTDREQELHQETQALVARERDLDRERERQTDRAAMLDRREAEVRSGTLRELERWAAETRSRLENLVREIREGELTREKTQAVKGFIAEIDDALAAEREKAAAAPAERGEERNELAEGAPVRIVSSGKEGTIRRKGKGSSWVVQVGPVGLPVDESDLEPIRPKRERTSVSYSGSSGRAELELDVRGYRLDEARDAVEHQIDQALLSGMRDFGIIHGMGEGVLQKAIRDLLQGHPSVASFEYARPEEGGFGKTNVHLR